MLPPDKSEGAFAYCKLMKDILRWFICCRACEDGVQACLRDVNVKGISQFDAPSGFWAKKCAISMSSEGPSWGCRLLTDADGIARNTFWLTDTAGKKLDTVTAELVAERVGDFVVYCTPSSRTLKSEIFKSGAITIDNKAHDKYTVVTVDGDKNKQQGMELRSSPGQVVIAYSHSR